MKALIVGAGGQVSRSLVDCAPQGIELVVSSSAEMDVRDRDAVLAVVSAARPDVIINPAAYTSVDRAESEAQTAWAVNDTGARNVAAAAVECGARLLHVSTDYVFSGDACVPYLIDSPTAPLGVYGHSKLAGERAVRQLLPGHSVILRTAWVYSRYGHNFVKTMLKFMREKGQVRVVADQFGTPTWARSVAEVLWDFAARPAVSGTHHWTDAGTASWYDFAVAIAEEALAAGMLTRSVDVQQTTTEEYGARALRPRFSVLDCRGTAAVIGRPQAHWRINLRRALGELRDA